MELQEAIKKRRSIRKFTERFVTDAEVSQLLDAARLAPSWANTQSWEFIVVRDRELMDKVTATYSSGNPARKCSLAASAMIVGCARRNVSGFKMGEVTTKFSEWFMFDLGLAVQNLCLKAHELGLGTVVVGLFDHDRCNELLGLPEGYDVVVTLPVGEPAQKGRSGPGRRTLEQISHLNRFGQ